MSDSEEDAHGGLSGFLFGNLDEDNRLEADYLDPDIREQLQSLGGDKLGLGGQLQELKSSKSRGKGKNHGNAGEVEKAADAVSYEDEDELIDFSPEQSKETSEGKTPTGAAGASPFRQKAATASKSKGWATEKPVLAKDGANVLLKFSQLFAEAHEPQKWHPRAQLRTITDGGLSNKHNLTCVQVQQSVDEETLFRSGSPREGLETYSQDSVESSEDEAQDLPVTRESKAPAQTLSAAQEKKSPGSQAMNRKDSGDAVTQGRPVSATADIALDPVQLVSWEDRIFWGEEDAAALGPGSEGEETEVDDREQPGLSSDPPTPSATNPMAAKEAVVQHSLLTSQHENVWLAESGWEEDVRWDSDGSQRPDCVYLDMNDPNLIFQLLQQNHSTEEIDKAAAMVVPAQPRIKIAGAQPLGKGRIFTLLARQNVSLDEEYAKRKAKKGSLASFKFRHAVPAMQLATLPPRFLDSNEALHRPRGVWAPLPSKGRAKVREGERSTVKLVSLVGHSKHASRGTFKADLLATTLGSLWEELIKGNRFADCRTLGAQQYDLWYRGPKPHPLPRDLPLAETDAPQDANMEISVTVYGMQVLPSRAANAIPDTLSSSPIPVAFQKTKQLTASDGHIILLEYLEETPLLLSRPGMVVRSSTYYRKTETEDLGHEALLDEEKWKVGSVEVLQPNEEAPFMLGDVQPGKHQLTLESNMCRSIGCAHGPPASDFLVIRAASGALRLREVTGYVTVGQQEPQRRIPVPQSKECRELEESRMVAHVMRELRRQKIKLEKKKNRDSILGETPPVITVRELADLFPSLSDGVIRSRLKDRCSCVSYKDDSAGTFRLTDGVAIADERELRQLARPEEWCAHQAMSNALARLQQQGLSQQDRLAAIPLDRLRIVAEQLSPPELYERAASELELLVLSTPWALTDNFVSALRENRGSLALTGPGDPTARGDGFSYMKEPIRSGAAKTVDAAAIKEGNITGTNKDLRRLSMVESKNLLLKLGLTEDDIKGLGRWQRIAAVRDLSTAAAGEEMGELGKIGTRYARVAKSSGEEQSRARRIQASQIFERQVNALQDDGRDVSDDESWGDELEKELEGNEVVSEKKGKATREDEDEAEDIEELRKGGFLGEGNESSPLMKSKIKLEAKAGDRRIKRTIVFMGLDGSRQTRTILYTDKDKIQALNDLYRRSDGKDSSGFGKRTISGGGTWLSTEDDAQAGRKTKKNMSKIRCKACGQMGHYKSNKLCPLYEQTYNKAAKAKKEAQDEEEKQPLRITLPSSPVKRKLSVSLSDPSKRARFDGLATSPSWKSQGSLRKQLGNRVLLKALAHAKATVPEQFWKPFLMAVTKASAPDYNNFVPSSQEMHLDRIEKKVKNSRYASGQEFLADCQKIADNAALYNAPGHGKFGGPALVEWAQALVDAIAKDLQSEETRPMLAEIEEAIRIQDAEKAAHAEAAHAEETVGEPAVEAPGVEEVPVIWVQCTRCQKWRKVSQKVNDETVPTTQDGAWHCDWDFERANASCDQPDDELAEQ